MKKLEALLDKLKVLLDEKGMRISEALGMLLMLVIMLMAEVAGIFIAIQSNIYIILSGMTFMWVWLIAACCVKKIFFNKLNNYLLETPKATALIFYIILIAILILSWKCLIGFIFSVILAFIIADYIKNLQANKNKEEDE